jgi:hypothetical protein
LDMGDGTSRVIMDDVGSDVQTRDASWKHECFYTHKRLPSKDIGDMALNDHEYQGIGEQLMARLVALNRRDT